jgi:hypothetical protein
MARLQWHSGKTVAVMLSDGSETRYHLWEEVLFKIKRYEFLKKSIELVIVSICEFGVSYK